MQKVDLNCDLGESFGNYHLGMDDQILPLITSANVACGFHASDPLTMQKTVKLAAENHVCVGAHPGLPDLVGFGRRKMDIKPEEAKAVVMYQIGALQAFCSANRIEMKHVKLHGALYNMAGKDEELAEAICKGIYEVNPNLILLGLFGSKMLAAARKVGLKAANEVFADRAYEEDGSLVPRGEPGAVITDENEAVKRVIGMIQCHTVTAITGKKIAVFPNSICVHGDNQKAFVFVQKIRKALEAEHIRICPLAETIS
ncbi:MAG: LamB/YcsF family protein [Oscillospiraceae bacterium]|jgi:UPF0271 protein|nr:LamB/YcsF family protein [Oscillospiraceae bacterium]